MIIVNKKPRKAPWKRATAKSLTWKITGIITLIWISWLLGIDPELIGKITLWYHIITLILYVIHERIWSKIKYGKKRKLLQE